MYEIQHYLTPDDDRDLYVEWLMKLKDTKAKIAAVRRVARIELGILEIINSVEMAYGNFVSTLVRVIGFITPLQGRKLYYCYVVVTNRRRMRTSAVLAHIGRVGKRRIHYENQNT